MLDWYAGNARPLPWRDPSCSPWGVLVSEVMSHQTPVARVEPVWREWMQRWPTPAHLAAESPGEVVRAWGRLGYPRRALRLREAAVAIVERHGGEVPDDEDALRALPGVGAYTAAAVAAFAFGRRTTVVDTNVRRVLVRAVEGRAHAAPALTAAESALAASLVPDGPGHLGDVERRRDGARRPGLPGPVPRGATSARCSTCAPGWQPAAPPTRGRRAAARRGTAPTARCAVPCSSCCATARARWPEPRWRPPGRTPARSTGASPRSSRTACSSRTARDRYRLPR